MGEEEPVPKLESMELPGQNAVECLSNNSPIKGFLSQSTGEQVNVIGVIIEMVQLIPLGTGYVGRMSAPGAVAWKTTELTPIIVARKGRKMMTWFFETSFVIARCPAFL